MKINIWKYYNKKQIYNIFEELSKNLVQNNSSYFHYTQYQLKQYLNNPSLDKKQRFQSFYLYWNNFQNKKRIIDKFFKTNNVEYPKIFKKKQRHIIKKFIINYNFIMNQINNYKAIKKEPPYAYIIIIKKLIKSIILTQIGKNKKINIIDIDINKNIIQFEEELLENKEKLYKFKLNKFLKKYQQLYPKKYKYCHAYMVISSNWKDLLLQSTFKQWTSCINLINTSSDSTILYSCTNGIKAGNLVAYCILDLNDNKSIDQILDDNGYNGLMYQRCFWRCSIKRYVYIKNYNDYMFCAENTSYGTILQNAISYKCNLFLILNKWLYSLNESIISYNFKQLYKIYKLPYNLYSDLHSYNIDTNDKKIYIFNYDNIKNKLKQNNFPKRKILKLLNKNKNLLSNDIIQFLNMFKHFNTDNIAKKYEENKIDYVFYKYFKRGIHYIIDNTKQVLSLLKKK